MGGKGSSSKTTETLLSKQQAAILANAQDQWMEVWFPELTDELNSMKGRAGTGGQWIGSEFVHGELDNFDRQQAASQGQLDRNLAQRGVTGSGVGSILRQRGSMERGAQRSSVLGGALAAQRAHKMQIMNLGISRTPTPTSAAPMGRTDKGAKAGFGSALLGAVATGMGGPLGAGLAKGALGAVK